MAKRAQKTLAFSRLGELETAFERANEAYFKHSDPGGLTPAEKLAWQYEEFALLLTLQAAQIRFIAEREIADLLKQEVADVG